VTTNSVSFPCGPTPHAGGTSVLRAGLIAGAFLVLGARRRRCDTLQRRLTGGHIINSGLHCNRTRLLRAADRGCGCGVVGAAFPSCGLVGGCNYSDSEARFGLQLGRGAASNDTSASLGLSAEIVLFDRRPFAAGVDIRQGIRACDRQGLIEGRTEYLLQSGHGLYGCALETEIVALRPQQQCV